MSNRYDEKINRLHGMYDDRKTDEREAKIVKRTLTTVGGAVLIFTGIAAANNDIENTVGGSVIAGTALGAAQNMQRRQRQAAGEAVELARTATSINVLDESSPVESWMIKALPNEEGDHVLQRVQNNVQHVPETIPLNHIVDVTKQ